MQVLDSSAIFVFMCVFFALKGHSFYYLFLARTQGHAKLSCKLSRVFFLCWCAKGSSFPAGAQQGLLSLRVPKALLSLLVHHRVFFPYWCTTGSSFPIGAPQGLLSLLVHHRLFFPYWYTKGSSFPTGAQQALLSLLVELSFTNFLWQLTKWHRS